MKIQRFEYWVNRRSIASPWIQMLRCPVLLSTLVSGSVAQKIFSLAKMTTYFYLKMKMFKYLSTCCIIQLIYRHHIIFINYKSHGKRKRWSSLLMINGLLVISDTYLHYWSVFECFFSCHPPFMQHHNFYASLLLDLLNIFYLCYDRSLNDETQIYWNIPSLLFFISFY